MNAKTPPAMQSAWFLRITAFCVFVITGVSLTAADPPEAAPGDASLNFPDPPEQHKRWSPPLDALDHLTVLVDAVTRIFDQGLADPRGCEYREIKITAGGSGFPVDDLHLPPVHGWLLPADGSAAQRYAVCWNGLVYPVLEVGKLCDLDADVAEMLKNAKGYPASQGMYYDPGIAVFEEVSVAYNYPEAIKAALLLRLGKTDSASKVLSCVNQAYGMFSNAGMYGRIAELWRIALYARAVNAQTRGDDPLALAYFRRLRAITAVIKKTIVDEKMSDNEDWMDNEIKFEDDYESACIADLERRIAEPPQTPALKLGRAKFPTEAAWINALIHDLEDAHFDRINYSLNPKMDPVMEALVKEGADAVEPLLDCFLHDERFTRSQGEYPNAQDFDITRPPQLMRVREAAYYVLRRIAKAGDLVNVYYFEYYPPLERANFVKRYREYWIKYGLRQ